VLLFTEGARNEKREEIRALYRAYNRAVDAINSDPDSFRQAIIRLGEFPPTVRDTMFIPRYHHARPPSLEVLTDVTGWMVDKGFIDRKPGYDEIVASALVP
jgi:NitT/TauT family transport system substrate-binding protein